MHPNEELLQRFYRSFHDRDGESMAACYAEDAEFHDPVFHLQGRDVGLMWRMLCASGKDLTVSAYGISADAKEGRVRWEARYTFSRTGRKVHNVVKGRFRFRDGLIVRHEDVFDFWRWSRMALGPAGWILGWSPLLRNLVRKQALTGLEKYRRDIERTK